jgi:hypothetical protein
VEAADQSGGGGGLSHASLLVGDGNDLSQGIFPPFHKNLGKSLKFNILQVDKKEQRYSEKTAKNFSKFSPVNVLWTGQSAHRFFGKEQFKWHLLPV